MPVRFGRNTEQSAAGGSANDGLSVNGMFIQLGQPVAGSGAQLLEDREIPMNGFNINFRGSASNTGVQIDNAGDVQLTGFVGVGGLFSPNAYTFFIGTPNNYGTVYPGHGVADQFYAGWQRFDGVNTYPRPNVVGQWWAYNYSTGGSPIQPLEAAFGYRTETDFDLNAGGQDYFELHQPEVAVPSGLTFRPWSFYISKTTGSTIHQSQIQNYNFNTKNENETYFGWTATTSGGPPDTDRTLDFEYSAKGNSALITQNYSDLGAIYAKATFQWDRGSLNFGLDATGASLNNKVISITGNIFQTGVGGTGSSFFVCRSNVDQPTEYSLQLFSDTFSNAPSYIFDRRTGGGASSILPDGTNGGEITYTGNRSLNISGIANGNVPGVTSCFDCVFSGVDTDGIIRNNALIKRDGTIQFPRGTIQTADPGAGAGNWLLGTVVAAAVALDATHYIETKINGVTVKIGIVL